MSTSSKDNEAKYKLSPQARDSDSVCRPTSDVLLLIVLTRRKSVVKVFVPAVRNSAHWYSRQGGVEVMTCGSDNYRTSTKRLVNGTDEMGRKEVETKERRDERKSR